MHLPSHVLPVAHVNGAEQASYQLYTQASTQLIADKFTADQTVPTPTPTPIPTPTPTPPENRPPVVDSLEIS